MPVDSAALSDIIKVLLGSLVGVGLAAILPFVLAMRREREDKLNLGAEATQKLIGAAGALQDDYQELLKEVKEQKKEARELAATYKAEIEQLRVQIIELQAQMAGLQAGIAILRQQVEKLGGTPEYPK